MSRLCLLLLFAVFLKVFLRNAQAALRSAGQQISDAFKDEADTWMILNRVLNVILDFAVKVHYNRMPNEDDYSEYVFRVIYRSIEQYFKTATV